MTAGTILHRSHLPLKTCFHAAHAVATRSNGIPALHVQGQPGIGSHKTAWLLLQKRRRAMVDPGRSLPQTLVEIDATEMPFRSEHNPAGGKRSVRSPVGRIFIVSAVELSGDGQPRRLRLAHIPDGSSKTLYGFTGQSVAPGAQVITDGRRGCKIPPANRQEVCVVDGRRAPELLHRVLRIFANLRRGAKGVCHGLLQAHVRRCLHGFVFQWNRRRPTCVAFDRLPDTGIGLGPATCRDVVDLRA